MDGLNRNLLARILMSGQGLSMNAPKLNALAGMLGTGLAPYGARYEESAQAPFSAKGKGYFGALPHSGGGVSTEISAHDTAGGFPLLVPSLTAEEVQVLLSGARPTQEIYRKAEAFAASRRSAGLNPFAQPNELRMPVR
jgi:hypothetical protein